MLAVSVTARRRTARRTLACTTVGPCDPRAGQLPDVTGESGQAIGVRAGGVPGPFERAEPGALAEEADQLSRPCATEGERREMPVRPIRRLLVPPSGEQDLPANGRYAKPPHSLEETRQPEARSSVSTSSASTGPTSGTRCTMNTTKRLKAHALHEHEPCIEWSGAKGTRTPDPHTASVVRYQLRHSPEWCAAGVPRLPERSYTTWGPGTKSPRYGG